MPHSNDVSFAVRDITDTARWVAAYRARETRRPDALFRDPFAERLAGERGFQIANTLPGGNSHDWAWVARTYLFDQFIYSAIHEGADLVLNLAAGLDARPFRMKLPADLHWVEVDLPEIISYKEEILSSEKPKCSLERVRLNLADLEARRSLFLELSRLAARIVVVSEGLLIYFTPEEVSLLARDLAETAHIEHWIVDLASPGQLKLMQRTTGKRFGDVGANFKFGPAEGPKYFRPYGWEPRDVQGLLKTAARCGRSPVELLPLLTDTEGRLENYLWTGVCLLGRS